MSGIPLCCITGRIAGDHLACGDCDPCGVAHLVPEAVKQLLKERDEWASKYESATEEQKHALYAAYKGISVLAIMCRKAGLSMAEQRSKDLMNELAEAFPELPGLLAIDR